jgi:ribosomal protein S13
MSGFKFKIKTDIFAKVNHRNYMGFRLRNGYPSKGQRTRTNAKTSRFRLHYVRYSNIIK